MLDYENNSPFSPGYPFSGGECPICEALNGWCLGKKERFEFLNKTQTGNLVIHSIHESFIYLVAESWDTITSNKFGGNYNGYANKPNVSGASELLGLRSGIRD